MGDLFHLLSPFLFQSQGGVTPIFAINHVEKLLEGPYTFSLFYRDEVQIHGDGPVRTLEKR